MTPSPSTSYVRIVQGRVTGDGAGNSADNAVMGAQTAMAHMLPPSVCDDPMSSKRDSAASVLTAGGWTVLRGK